MSNRSPNGINVHRFLEGFGIKVLPYRESRMPRPANVVYGGRQISRLMRKDMERTGQTIRCIQVSNPRCLDDATVWSVWCFIGAHYPLGAPPSAIKAFARVDVAFVRKRAQRLVIGEGGRMTKMAVAMSILLADEIIGNEEKAA